MTSYTNKQLVLSWIDFALQPVDDKHRNELLTVALRIIVTNDTTGETDTLNRIVDAWKSLGYTSRDIPLLD